MNPTTAAEWVNYHCTAFGITGEADLQGVLSWARTFLAAGVTLDDLASATNWMLLNVAPQWRREHLGHIQRHLAGLRMRRLADQRAAAQGGRGEFNGSFCGSCDDTGFVSVPHPADVVADRWGGKYTAVVACPCAKGDAVAGRWSTESGDRRPLARIAGLIAYERHFPNWRDMVFRKRDTDREFAQRAGEAEYADRSAGPLVRKLAERFSMPNRTPRS